MPLLMKVKFDSYILDTTISLTKYFKNVYNLEVLPDQPLLLVKQKSKSNENRRFIPPQLCVMLGLTDDMVQDTELMKNISQHTKLTPGDKISSIDDVMKLLNEKQGIIKTSKETQQLITLRSPAEKMADYGINVTFSVDNSFYGYSMTVPSVRAKDNSKISYSNSFRGHLRHFEALRNYRG